MYLFGVHNAMLTEEICGNELAKEIYHDGEVIGEIQPYLEDIVLVENVLDVQMACQILEEMGFNTSLLELEDSGKTVFSTVKGVCTDV